MKSAGRNEKQIPLLDLTAQHAPLREEILDAITRVVDSQQFVLGKEVSQFERAVADYCAVPHAVGCGSGSDALFLALLAAGVGPGDAVATTPFTFFATAGATSRAGAVPVFADIDPDTFNISPDALAALLRSRAVKAIIPVHLYGGCADMDPILALAREHGCIVIEDGAQAIGAEYKERRALSLGDLGCLSFFPSKNLGAMGEAGMVTTPDAALAAKLAALRVHGSSARYYHETIGINSRLDTIQAAVLLVKLRYLDSWTAARQRNAAAYAQSLDGVPVVAPRPAGYQTRHIFNQFVIRCPRRDELKQWLAENGVASEIYYPLPLHLQNCYRHLEYREGAFPQAERAAREVLALPVHPGLSGDDITFISNLIAAFYHTRL